MAKERYIDRKHETLQHSFMLFIEGVEVSAWASQTIAWALAGKSGPNTCSFTLSNAGNTFVYTPANAAGRFNQAPGMYSEKAKRAIYQRKKNSPDNVIDPLTGDRRWPFRPWKPIFHKNDRVRLLIKHPTRTGRWYPVFTGFLVGDPLSEDYVSGTSNISIQCEDIRSIMDKMRIRTNPLKQEAGGMATPEALFDEKHGVDELFRDLELQPRFTHILAGLSFTEIMDFLLTGGPAFIREDNKGQNFGVGNLNRGRLYEVTPRGEKFGVEVSEFKSDRSGDPVSDVNASLEGWNDLCLFGYSEEPLTTAQAIRLGRNTFIGGSADPINQDVHFLLPAAATEFNDMVQFSKDLIGSWDRTWQTRLSLVEEIVERVGYEWYVTGIGDIVFEFPMVDFRPEFYGRYKSALETELKVKSQVLTPESGNITTALTATGGFLYAEDPEANVGGVNPQYFFPRTWVLAPVLTSRVGGQPDVVTFPHIKDSALLCLYTLVEFFRRLARVTQLNLEIMYRLPLLPNRPFHFIAREKMATIETINYDLSIENGQAHTSLTLTMPRDKGEDGKFRFITGGQASPITYRSFEGIGHLISIQSGLTTKCEEAPDVRRLKQAGLADFMSTDGFSKSAGRGTGAGMTRDEVRSLAASLGATEEETLAAMVINSEDPHADDITREAIIHTIFNRVGTTHKDSWTAIMGRKQKTTGEQAGRQYSTAQQPSSQRAWDRHLATVRRVKADNAAGRDPTNGATNFMHPKAFGKSPEGQRKFRATRRDWNKTMTEVVAVQHGSNGQRTARTNPKHILLFRPKNRNKTEELPPNNPHKTPSTYTGLFSVLNG